MKIYTFSGDDGTTSLPGGKRVKKHDPRLEACGSVDELIAWIGLLRDHKENLKRKDLLVYIQDQLMRCSGVLASETYFAGTSVLPGDESLTIIENEIDKMQAGLSPLVNFILPGGNILVSWCHISRCVCRRAERDISKLNEIEPLPEIILKLMNRLSDFLFVLARQAGNELDCEEIKWTL